jgi:hypothetical protein
MILGYHSFFVMCKIFFYVPFGGEWGTYLHNPICVVPMILGYHSFSVMCKIFFYVPLGGGNGYRPFVNGYRLSFRHTFSHPAIHVAMADATKPTATQYASDCEFFSRLFELIN